MLVDLKNELINLENSKEFSILRLKIKYLNDKIDNTSAYNEKTLKSLKAKIAEDFETGVDVMMHKHFGAQSSKNVLFAKYLTFLLN